MESINKQTLNPWISMWTKPRSTIQQIVNENPTYLVLVLAAIVGFFQGKTPAASAGQFRTPAARRATGGRTP